MFKSRSFLFMIPSDPCLLVYMSYVLTNTLEGESTFLGLNLRLEFFWEQKHLWNMSNSRRGLQSFTWSALNIELLLYKSFDGLFQQDRQLNLIYHTSLGRGMWLCTKLVMFKILKSDSTEPIQELFCKNLLKESVRFWHLRKREKSTFCFLFVGAVKT